MQTCWGGAAVDRGRGGGREKSLRGRGETGGRQS